MIRDPCEERREIGRLAKTCRQLGRIGRRNLVDHEEPRRGRRPMLGIDFPGDRGGEQDRRLFLQPDEAVTKGRSLGRAIRADDRNQPPSFAEPRERGGDMAKRGASHRSEEHTSELQSLMRNSYAVFCLKKKTNTDESTQK